MHLGQVQMQVSGPQCTRNRAAIQCALTQDGKSVCISMHPPGFPGRLVWLASWLGPGAWLTLRVRACPCPGLRGPPAPGVLPPQKPPAPAQTPLPAPSGERTQPALISGGDQWVVFRGVPSFGRRGSSRRCYTTTGEVWAEAPAAPRPLRPITTNQGIRGNVHHLNELHSNEGAASKFPESPHTQESGGLSPSWQASGRLRTYKRLPFFNAQ